MDQNSDRKKSGKHHKLYQRLVVVTFCMMILNQPVSSCPNFAVTKIKIYSEFSKGHVRIEGNKVVASECKYNCWDPAVMEKNFLYKVTIDKHYMLLYHIKTGKFICWNKSFKKLVAKRNPPNLMYCKFADNVSIIQAFKGSKLRYTTRVGKDKEIEMRFNRSGAFAKPKLIKKCVSQTKLRNKGWKEEDFLKLNPANIMDGSREMDAYLLLIQECANPHFLRSDINKCKSGLPDFCKKMKKMTNDGHSISSEIIELCKNEWSKNN